MLTSNPSPDFHIPKRTLRTWTEWWKRYKEGNSFLLCNQTCPVPAPKAPLPQGGARILSKPDLEKWHI